MAKTLRHAARERHLREVFRSMDGDRAQEIREAYYKAIEGLQTLTEALELADVELGGPQEHALISEHLIACQALESLNESVLGRIL